MEDDHSIDGRLIMRPIRCVTSASGATKRHGTPRPGQKGSRCVCLELHAPMRKQVELTRMRRQVFGHIQWRKQRGTPCLWAPDHKATSKIRGKLMEPPPDRPSARLHAHLPKDKYQSQFLHNSVTVGAPQNS